MKKWLAPGALFVVILVTFYYFHDRRIERGDAQFQGERTAPIVQRESEITRTPTDSHPEVSIENPATADYIHDQRTAQGTAEFQGETDAPIVQRKPEITRTPAPPPLEVSSKNRYNTTTSAKFGDYVLVVTQNGGFPDVFPHANGEFDPQLYGVDLDIKDKKGKNLHHTWSQKFLRFRHAEAGGSYVINSAEDFFAVPLEDVNGNGVTDLVFIAWSGDAHCCYTTHVLELGKKFSVVWPDDVRHAGAELVDIDGDGDEEIVTQNFEFATMWKSEQTTGPNHQSVVILASRWYGGVSEPSKTHFDIFSLDRASLVWKRLAQDDGYGMAEILTADITGDGLSEIILSDINGSGGFLDYWIYGFIGDELQGLKRTKFNKGFLGLYGGSLKATENGLLENSGERFTLYSWNGTTFIGTRVKEPLDPTYTGHVLHYSIQVTEQGERVVSASQVSMKVGETLRLVRDDLSDTSVRIMGSGNGVLVWVNRGEYKAVKIGETGFTITPNGHSSYGGELEISVVVVP